MYRADHALHGHDVPDEGVLVLRHIDRHLAWKIRVVVQEKRGGGS